MTVRVASASETVACERATMEEGVTSGKLMRRAGSGAAAQIRSRYASLIQDGAVIYAGGGNNGGDGWIVAEELAKNGISARVIELESPRSLEAEAARDGALAAGARIATDDSGNERVVIDAVLGTGVTGVPHGKKADAIARIAQRRSAGATVVALDVPSGLDATSGAREGAVVADLTISFGTLKRGELIARGNCGEITVIDIGLSSNVPESLPVLVDRDWVSERIPRIAFDAHKGTRQRLSIVGGGPGMAGATILAGEGALRSGIGLLRIVAAAPNAIAIHAAIPAALFQEWPSTPDKLAKLAESSDAIAIGPGLGNSHAMRDLVERILLAWNGPVVLDADGLNVFAGDLDSLATLLSNRPAILTPHPAEMGRLIGVGTDEVLKNRFEIGLDVAARLGAAILLKGTPTVVFSPNGGRFVSAAGTAALATGGSGDVLTGISATLLAQMSGDDRSANAAACAAFIHGRAAELCEGVRGTTLDDVLRALPAAWNEKRRSLDEGVLAALGSNR